MKGSNRTEIVHLVPNELFWQHCSVSKVLILDHKLLFLSEQQQETMSKVREEHLSLLRLELGGERIDLRRNENIYQLY